MIADSNVIIDLAEGAPGAGSYERLLDTVVRHRLRVNEIIFAEVSGRYASVDATREILAALQIRFVKLTQEDCHRAGLAFRRYRQNGGQRAAILPDFLIGAQAAQNGWPLLTRDRKGFATYFPEVELIDPYRADND